MVVEKKWQPVHFEQEDVNHFPVEGSRVLESNGKPVGYVLQLFKNNERGYAPTACLYLKGTARYAYPGIFNEKGEFCPLCEEKVYACFCCKHKHEENICRLNNMHVDYAYYG